MFSLDDARKRSLEFIVDTRDAIVGTAGMTFEKAVSMMQGLTVRLVVLAQGLDISGPEKKKFVLERLDAFYDVVIKPLDIPYIPGFVEAHVDEGLKKILLAMADGSIDTMVKLFQMAGWPESDDVATDIALPKDAE